MTSPTYPAESNHVTELARGASQADETLCGADQACREPVILIMAGMRWHDSWLRWLCFADNASVIVRLSAPAHRQSDTAYAPTPSSRVLATDEYVTW